MELLQDQFIQLLGTVLTLVFGYAVKQFKDYLNRKGVLAELQNKQKYADIVVRAAKDIYTEAEGDKKLAAAKGQLVELLNKQGIPVTEEEIDSLVRAAYQGMKDGAGL